MSKQWRLAIGALLLVNVSAVSVSARSVKLLIDGAAGVDGQLIIAIGTLNASCATYEVQFNLGPAPCVAAYNALAGDSAGTVASGLAANINGDSGCQLDGISATASGQTITLSGLATDQRAFLSTGESSADCDGCWGTTFPGPFQCFLRVGDGCSMFDVLDGTDCNEDSAASSRGGGGGLDFLPAPPSDIPTVSAWGLIVMTLLLLMGLKIKFGARQRKQA